MRKRLLLCGLVSIFFAGSASAKGPMSYLQYKDALRGARAIAAGAMNNTPTVLTNKALGKMNINRLIAVGPVSFSRTGRNARILVKTRKLAPDQKAAVKMLVSMRKLKDGTWQAGHEYHSFTNIKINRSLDSK